VRFAIKTRPEHTTWAQIRDVWLAADKISLFESGWNWDHFYPLSGDLTGPNLEGWTMLAALAQATSRIRTAAAYRDASADLAIMNLPHGAGPDILTSLADALSPLA